MLTTIFFKLRTVFYLSLRTSKPISLLEDKHDGQSDLRAVREKFKPETCVLHCCCSTLEGDTPREFPTECVIGNAAYHSYCYKALSLALGCTSLCLWQSGQRSFSNIMITCIHAQVSATSTLPRCPMFAFLVGTLSRSEMPQGLAKQQPTWGAFSTDPTIALPETKDFLLRTFHGRSPRQ